MTEDEMYDIIRGYEDSERDYHERNIELEAENAKLRELCAEMFEAVKCCCGEWCTKTASNCDNNECGWHKCYVALRELGIKVDDETDASQ